MCTRLHSPPKSAKSAKSAKSKTAKSAKSQASSAAGENKVPSPGKAPSIKDIESSLAESKQDEAGKKPPSQSGPGRLTLPTTTIPVSKPKQDSEPESPAGEQVAPAIEEQDKLIEEFAKVVDEIEYYVETYGAKNFPSIILLIWRRLGN